MRHRHSAPGVADGFGSSDVGPASAVIIILYLVKEIYEKMKGVILISSLSIETCCRQFFTILSIFLSFLRCPSKQIGGLLAFSGRLLLDFSR